jgi:hypothetical protein
MTLQAGRYYARALPETVQFGRATTGTEQIAITFRILDAVMHGAETGDEITWIGALGNEKSLEITAKALRACGCEDPEELEADPTCVARNVVELDIQSEMYQGKAGLRVKWVNTPRRFSFKQALDAGSKANALSRLKGYAIRDAQANGAPPAAQRHVDDIPF